MAVLHGRTEKFLEPVRVAHLGLAEICFPTGFGVLHKIFTCRGIVFVHQLVHLAVHTSLRAEHVAVEVEPALLVHFLINGHLLLGIHDIELGI